MEEYSDDIEKEIEKKQNNSELTEANSKVLEILKYILNQPFMTVSREDFLKATFQKSPNINEIIEYGPAKAGVSKEKLKKIAEDIKQHHRNKTTFISTLCGMPGGWWMAGTIPADLSQFLMSLFVGAQKISYLYDYKLDIDDCPDEHKNILFLSVMDVMLGDALGNMGEKIIRAYGESVAKNISCRVFTKAPIHKVINTLLTRVGAGHIGKKTLAEFIKKGIPFISGAISGIITYNAANSAFDRWIELMDKYKFENE